MVLNVRLSLAASSPLFPRDPCKSSSYGCAHGHPAHQSGIIHKPVMSAKKHRAGEESAIARPEPDLVHARPGPQDCRFNGDTKSPPEGHSNNQMNRNTKLLRLPSATGFTDATELRQGAVTPRTSASSSPGADADEFILQHTATVSQSLSTKHAVLQ